MKPLPKNKRLLLQKKEKRLLLQKTMRGEVQKLREMVASMLGRGMSTAAPETATMPPGKKVIASRGHKWRRKL